MAENEHSRYKQKSLPNKSRMSSTLDETPRIFLCLTMTTYFWSTVRSVGIKVVPDQIAMKEKRKANILQDLRNG